MSFREKIQYKHVVIVLSLVLVLSGCSIPDAPDGIEREGLSNLGDRILARGDDAGAADFYQRALQRYPDDALTHAKLATILETHGNLVDAASHYAEAVRLKVDNADVYRNYGRLLIKLNRPEDARPLYETAIKKDSSDVKAYNGMGVALDMLGDHAAAQKVYKNALGDHPEDMSLLNNLAHSYVLSENFGEAIKLLEPYAEDAKATPAMRQNLAEAYGMAGMDADAERVAKRDLKPSQVKRNLAAYRERRKHLEVISGYYADLGQYPTKGMVDARVAYLKSDMAADMDGLVIDDSLRVNNIGGTPSFALRITGFARAERATSFCEKLMKIEQDCKVVSGR